MAFSEADFIAMRARLQRNLKSKSDYTAEEKNVREVGKGGIQDQIEEWMKMKVPNIWWDRKRTDKATTSRIGTPDFVGVYLSTAFALEVKRPGQKPTMEQLGELKWLESAGAEVAIVHSLEEAIEFFRKLT